MSTTEGIRDPSKIRVAVIGLGVSGLVTLKNLLEQGYDVVGFERNTYVGGLWRFTEDPGQLSVLKTTQSLGGKGFVAFTDFPFPKDCPEFPPASTILEYIDSYVEHHHLLEYSRLGRGVKQIRPNRDGSSVPGSTTQKKQGENGSPPMDGDPGVDVGLGVGVGKERRGEWEIEFADGETLCFDKVVVTNGPFDRPWIPPIRGLNEFKGEIVHANAYKGPERFKGRRVIVVGTGPTGADVAVDLVGSAANVFWSHRHGARPIPRWLFGRPFDYLFLQAGHQPFFERITSLLPLVIRRLLRIPPPVSRKEKMDNLMRKLHPGLRDEWRLLPGPDFTATQTPFVVNDNIIPKIRDESIVPIHPIWSFGPHTVELDNDKREEIEVEAVIFATTGYTDYSILSPEADPTKARPTEEWDDTPETNGIQFPWLYQTMFHLDHPESLAFLGPVKGVHFSAFRFADIQSAALGQVWKGAFSLPSKGEMEKWCEDNYMENLDEVRHHRITRTGTDQVVLERWINQAAGNGMDDYLGWGWKAWWFWLSDRKLYNLLKHGRKTPFVYRLFEGREGGRKKWDGARDAIIQANSWDPPVTPGGDARQ